MTKAEIVDKMYGGAKRYHDTYYDPDEEDTSFVKITKQDIDDLVKIGTLISEDKDEEARRLSISLDTLVRDYIPQVVWEYLHGDPHENTRW